MYEHRYFEPIKALLERNGAMGVSDIAKDINAPISSVQKYLDKQQSYFKKIPSRKWVLPEKAGNPDTTALKENYAAIVENQLNSVEMLLDTAMTQFRTTLSIMHANKPENTPVADRLSNIDPKLEEWDKKLKTTQAVFKKYVGNCPEEYQPILKNVDLYALAIAKGSEYLSSHLNAEITSLFTGQQDFLSEEVVSLLKEFQKEA